MGMRTAAQLQARALGRGSSNVPQQPNASKLLRQHIARPIAWHFAPQH